LDPGFDPRALHTDAELEEAVKKAEFSDEQLLRAFYTVDRIGVRNGRLWAQIPEHGPTNIVGMRADHDIKGRGAEPIVRSGK
ncbi:hypothetical protein ABTB59_19365, partial [Acinetobacter baumannii]